MPLVIDIEGSGALQYLRPEIANPPAIHLSLSEVPQRIVQLNAMTLPHTLVLTCIPGDIGFEARANLLQVQSTVRTTRALVGSDDILAATESLRRLEARENESIEEWADKLSRDLSAHHDYIYMSFITVKCPSWDYETVADWNSILAARSKAALVRLRQLSPERRIALGRDGRPVHGQYFAGLTPPGCAYYASHYRGEDFTCLKDYRVIIQGDPFVGHAPDRVQTDMEIFAADFVQVVADGDFVWAVNNTVVSPAEKLYRIVQLGVAVFVYFLQIHPYANGNGHLARFFLIAFLARYNIYLARWPLHPRPQDPPYSELIRRYRRGDRASLEHFVLSCI